MFVDGNLLQITFPENFLILFQYFECRKKFKFIQKYPSKHHIILSKVSMLRSFVKACLPTYILKSWFLSFLKSFSRNFFHKHFFGIPGKSLNLLFSYIFTSSARFLLNKSVNNKKLFLEILSWKLFCNFSTKMLIHEFYHKIFPFSLPIFSWNRMLYRTYQKSYRLTITRRDRR